MRFLRSAGAWSPDRLHLTAQSHQRVALRACEVLGVPVTEDWRAPLAADPPQTAVDAVTRAAWLAARREDARWAREYLAPWISRRLHGTSSGDGLSAKRPALEPVSPPIVMVTRPRQSGFARERLRGGSVLPSGRGESQQDDQAGDDRDPPDPDRVRRALGGGREAAGQHAGGDQARPAQRGGRDQRDRHRRPRVVRDHHRLEERAERQRERDPPEHLGEQRRWPRWPRPAGPRLPATAALRVAALARLASAA